MAESRRGKLEEAASEMGKVGGKKGGPARAASLTAEERHKIAMQGAEASKQTRAADAERERRRFTGGRGK